MLISPHWSCGHKPIADKLVHIQRDYVDTLKTTAISSFIIQETKNNFATSTVYFVECLHAYFSHFSNCSLNTVSKMTYIASTFYFWSHWCCFRCHNITFKDQCGYTMRRYIHLFVHYNLKWSIHLSLVFLTIAILEQEQLSISNYNPLLQQS